MLDVTELIGFGAGGEETAPAVFVAANTVDSASGNIVWPTGAQAGDIAIVAMTRAAAAAPTFSWGTLAVGPLDLSGSSATWYIGVLTSGDLSSPPAYSNATNGGYSIVCYRGGTAIAAKNSLGGQTGSTITIPGFTKNASSLGVIAAFMDRDPGSGSSAVAPTGFTMNNKTSITFFGFGWASVDPSGYTDSASAQFTGLVTSFNQSAAFFEIT